MAKFRITGPDGNTYEITAPDDATEQQVLAYAQSNYQPAVEYDQAQGSTTAPDFSNVVGGSRTVRDDSLNPTQGMGQYPRYLAGLVDSVVTTGKGLKQGAIELGGLLSQVTAGSPEARALASQQYQPVIEETRQDVAAYNRDMAPLRETGMGKLGNVVGAATQVFGPGAVFRGTPVAGAFLPATIRGNIAQGAAVGAAQPVETGGERALNTTVGAGLGGLGASIGPLASRARAMLPPFSQAAQTRAAGNVLEQFAADVNALRAGASNPEIIVPGSMPTLAESTGDVGLAGLQRTMANTPEYGNQLASRQAANNQARVAEIQRVFGGADPIASDAARSTRDVMARRVLSPNRELPMQGLDKVTAGVSRIAEKHQASPAVRTAMEAVAAELPNIRTVGDAHAVRQYIGQLIGGQVEGKAGAKLAKRELMTVQTLLDREMRNTFPEWGNFLRDYKAISREADQIDVGAALLDTGRAVRGATNEPVLTPAAFSRAAGNLDGLVQRATGFRKASASRTLDLEQQAAVANVRRDLERFARSQTDGKAVGSNTVQNAIGGNRFQDAVGPVGAAAVEPISGIALLGLNQMRKAYGAKVASLVEEAMLDPRRAAEILAAVPASQREKVVRDFARLLPRAGVLAPSFSE